MTDAEKTIKHAILSAMRDNWSRKYREDWAEETKDLIFDRLFSFEFRHAVEEYLTEKPSPKPKY